MSRPLRVFLYVAGLYAFCWVGYVAKSAAHIDVIHDGVHHGPIFPGSDQVVSWLDHA